MQTVHCDLVVSVRVIHGYSFNYIAFSGPLRQILILLANLWCSPFIYCLSSDPSGTLRMKLHRTWDFEFIVILVVFVNCAYTLDQLIF